LIVATVQSGDKSSFRMQQRDCFGTFTLIFLHLFSCGLSAIIVAIRYISLYLRIYLPAFWCTRFIYASGSSKQSCTCIYTG
jgi:hypothetical protein